MDEIVVEGFRVMIERTDTGFFATAPRLPGCSAQAESIEEVRRAMREMIGLYMLGMVAKKRGGRPEAGRLATGGRARQRRRKP